MWKKSPATIICKKVLKYMKTGCQKKERRSQMESILSKLENQPETDNRISSNDIKSYIEMAQIGHYPLFHDQWLSDDMKSAAPISFRLANKNVKETFEKLSRHRSCERKKTVISALAEGERKMFVQSFMKVVEHNILKDLKTLH